MSREATPNALALKALQSWKLYAHFVHWPNQNGVPELLARCINEGEDALRALKADSAPATDSPTPIAEFHFCPMCGDPWDGGLHKAMCFGPPSKTSETPPLDTGMKHAQTRASGVHAGTANAAAPSPGGVPKSPGAIACEHENTRHDACSNDRYCHGCKCIVEVAGKTVTPIPLATYQAKRPDVWDSWVAKECPDSAKPGGLTHDELVMACRNIGYDLTCGACAAVFFTGFGLPHDTHTCEQRTETPLPEVWVVEAFSAHESNVAGVFASEDESRRFRETQPLPEGAVMWACGKHPVKGSTARAEAAFPSDIDALPTDHPMRVEMRALRALAEDAWSFIGLSKAAVTGLDPEWEPKYEKSQKDVERRIDAWQTAMRLLAKDKHAMKRPKRIAFECPAPTGKVFVGIAYDRGVTPTLVMSDDRAALSAALDKATATKLRDWLTAWLASEGAQQEPQSLAALVAESFAKHAPPGAVLEIKK